MLGEDGIPIWVCIIAVVVVSILGYYRRDTSAGKRPRRGAAL